MAADAAAPPSHSPAPSRPLARARARTCAHARARARARPPPAPADHIRQAEAHARLPELRGRPKLPDAQQLEQAAPQQRDLVGDRRVEAHEVAGGAHKRERGAAEVLLGV
jgi:hypothetical protein